MLIKLSAVSALLAKGAARGVGGSFLLAALLAAALASSACSDGQRAPQVITVPSVMEAAKRGTMTVTGSATLRVSPDCADLVMTVSVEELKPGAAASGAQSRQRGLVSALRAAGVAGDDLKLSELRLSPVYAQTPDRVTSKITGYRGEVTVVVTTKKFERIGALMEVGANAGATDMSSQFRRSDLPELKKQVRDLALRAAKEKAEQTAKTLDIKLGRVVNVTEAPVSPNWGRSLYSNYVGNAGPSASSADDSLGGTLEPLTLDITLELDLPQA